MIQNFTAATTTFPGYLSSEAASNHIPGSPELQAASSDFPRVASSEFPRREINPLSHGSYGIGDMSGVGVGSECVINVMSVAGGKACPLPLEDFNLLSKRGDAPVSITSVIPDVINDRSGSLRNDGPLVSRGESNILFVDGLPTDCTRREVGHLFRPFIGYKDTRVVHKEPRRTGDRAMVLCFVEFVDTKCAKTAMEALQGYKFDDKKTDSPVLRIQFAHFPFRLHDS